MKQFNYCADYIYEQSRPASRYEPIHTDLYSLLVTSKGATLGVWVGKDDGDRCGCIPQVCKLRCLTNMHDACTMHQNEIILGRGRGNTHLLNYPRCPRCAEPRLAIVDHEWSGIYLYSCSNALHTYVVPLGVFPSK